MPLAHVTAEWDGWRDLEPEFGAETEGHQSHPADAITERYINLGWIPFLKDWGGNSVGVDLTPSPAGVPGQVITFGRDEDHKFVLAASLDAFLAEYVARLTAGRVSVSPAQGEGDGASLVLHDADGKPVEGYQRLADLFPGFGAAPERPTAQG